MTTMGMTGQEQVGTLIRQWITESSAAGGSEAARFVKAEWEAQPADLSGAQAVAWLQKKMEENSVAILGHDEEDRQNHQTLSAGEAGYVAEKNRARTGWLKRENQERQAMIDALRKLK